jgi:hypothetical protein
MTIETEAILFLLDQACKQSEPLMVERAEVLKSEIKAANKPVLVPVAPVGPAAVPPVPPKDVK